MKKNVLITGGSHAELPLIDALHRLGYRVVSTGMNTDGLGHKAADCYVPADFSRPEAVLALAKEQEVCGIVSGCNDFAYLSTAYACERLGLPGHDRLAAAEQIHHKERFRAVLRRCGLPFPDFRLLEYLADLEAAKAALRLPVVVKPTDLTGGKGVAVCRDWAQAAAQTEAAFAVTRRSAVLIEEYIEGSNHGVSALLRGGRVVFAFFDNEEYFLNPYLVSGAYSPSSLSEKAQENVRRQLETLAAELGLVDGLFHCQCIVQEGGAIYLIDPCRRAPGDLYIQLVSESTGIDYPLAIVKSELGLPIDEELAFTPLSRCIARECMMAEQNGRITGFSLSPDYAAKELSRLQWGRVGDLIEDYLRYKAGIVFFAFDNPQEMQEKMQRLYEHMRIEVQPLETRK